MANEPIQSPPAFAPDGKSLRLYGKTKYYDFPYEGVAPQHPATTADLQASEDRIMAAIAALPVIRPLPAPLPLVLGDGTAPEA
jgi:hypothetical protein